MPSTHLLIQAVILGLLLGGVYALMASGLTLVFGVMRVINIAHAAFIILAAYLTYSLNTRWGVDPMLAVLLTAPALFVLGLLVQRLMLSRLKEERTAMSVLVTFAIALLIEGALGLGYTGSPRSILTSYTASSLEVATFNVPADRLMAFGSAVVILALLYLILARTRLGRAIRATVQDRQAAELVGVDVEYVSAVVFAIGIALAAVGGSLLAILFTFSPATHWEWISRLLAIIVLGGMGSLAGALVAALVLGIVEALAAVVFATYWAPVVFPVVLFAILILRPQGLFGQRGREGV